MYQMILLAGGLAIASNQAYPIKFTPSLRGTDVFHLLLCKILYDVSLKLDCNGIEKQRARAVPSSSCSGKLHPVCSKTVAYTHGFV